MNQSSLAKHLGVSVSSLKAKAKKYAFQEGREYTFENKGEKGKERKNFTLMGIRRLEKGFQVPKKDWYRPQGSDDGWWEVDKVPSNKRLIFLKHTTTGETARCAVKPALQNRFRRGTRIWEGAVEDVTPDREGAEKRFHHKNKYPKQRTGRYHERAEDGTLV